MRARAESVQRTQRRILEAAQGLLWERLSMDVRLEDVAERAGVTVQTVLRRFGNREKLLEAALAAAQARVTAARAAADPGDIHASITVLFEHYEDVGDLVVRRLAEEGRDPNLGRMLAIGRTEHRRWVYRQFGPQLHLRADPAGPNQQATASGEQLGGPSVDALVDALVVACDVYAWKLLRRDLGRNREQAQFVMRQTVRSLLTSWPPDPPTART
jgi:AcrR family transcriptional regulator